MDPNAWRHLPSGDIAGGAVPRAERLAKDERRGRLSDALKAEYAASDLLTAAEAAREMRCSVRTIYYLVRQGMLSSESITQRRVAIPKAAITRYRAAQARLGAETDAEFDREGLRRPVNFQVGPRVTPLGGGH
jgi:excisionase family DNA binding protein